MTLNIIGIEEDPTLPSDQFWTAAADLLIQIASVQPKMGQAIDAVIDDGGDIEITAHNPAGTITVTLWRWASDVLFDGRETSDHKSAA